MSRPNLGSTIQSTGITRRTLLERAWASAMGLLWMALPSLGGAREADDYTDVVKRLVGKTPIPSDRIHLIMPAVFPNGYTVPMSVEVVGPVTETVYVKQVHVLAPQNPLLRVVTFRFIPQRSQPRVSTRIRLAKPQYVLALAEMSDGSILMNKTWVKVSSNGCA